MAHALEIPELRVHLSKFLTLDQLFVCVLVCKDWHASFTPMLYFDIMTRPCLNPKLETLRKYSEHVRILNVNGILAPSFCSIRYNNIIKLIIQTGSTKCTPSQETLSQLIQANENSLRNVFFNMQPLNHPDRFWSALARCSKISRVSMYNTDINVGSLVPFFTVCSKVARLNIGGFHLNTTTTFQEAVEPLTPFLNLTRITYNGSIVQRPMERVILVLIKNSPNLDTLSWSNTFGWHHLIHLDNMMEYRNSMVSRKNLKYLSLNGMMGDQDSALALKAMTNAIRVSLRYVSFNHQAHTTLIENHANTIVYLDISLCADTSGTMAQEILSRCPSLEYFGVDHIRGTDLVRIVPSGDGESENIVLGQEWVCLRLKSLIMYFDMSTDLSKDRSTSESKVLFQRQQKLEQLHVFRQLSRLCALEILDIRGTQPRPTNLNLKLRTKGGELETLKTLKKLRKFLTRHPFDDESVGWIKKNWPNYEF